MAFFTYEKVDKGTKLSQLINNFLSLISQPFIYFLDEDQCGYNYL